MYALCGLLIFPLRNTSPKALFVTAGLALVLMQAFFTVPVFERRSTRNAAVAARAAQAQGRTLTQEQRDAIRDWDRIYNASLPPREEVQKEIDDYRGGYVRTYAPSSIGRQVDRAAIVLAASGSIFCEAR